MSNSAASSSSPHRPMMWGSHPAYAGGAWIKLARLSDLTEIRRRLRQGFVLRLGLPPEDRS